MANLSETKVEALADEFTNKAMTEEYGSRFTELENLEDDEELSQMWEELNSGFYLIMHNLL